MSARLDLPRADDKAEDCTEKLTSSQIHVSWKKGHGVVGEGYGVPRHVRPDHSEGEEKTDKELRCSIVPHKNNDDGIPLDLAIDNLG